MKVFALIYDENDSHDIGSHEAILDLFADNETAERVAGMLIGLPMLPGRNHSPWGPYDGLEVREMEVR
jgi:hypothetical protein